MFSRVCVCVCVYTQIAGNPALYAAWWQDSKTLLPPAARRAEAAALTAPRPGADTRHTAGGALLFAEVLSRAVIVLTVGVLVAHGISDSSGSLS